MFDLNLDPGVIALVVFGIMIVFWCLDRLPMAFVAMAGCVTCVLLKVCSLPQAMFGFTNDLIFLVAGMEIVGIALFQVGLASLVGRVVLKLAKDDEKRLMIISFCAAAVMSAFLSNMTVVIFFLVIFRSVAKTSDHIDRKNVTLPMIAGAITGGSCTLIGSTPQLAAQSVIERQEGMEAFKMFDFTPLGIPVVIVTGLALYFYGYGHGKRMWARAAARKGGTIAGPVAGALEPAGKEGKDAIDLTQPVPDRKKLYIMGGIMVLLLTLMVSEVVTVGTAAMTAGLLSIVTGCVTQKRAFAEMNWNVVIWLAGCFGIANIMDISGGTALMTTAITSVIPAGIPPYLFFAIVTFVCMVVTQLMSNTACVLVFMPIFLPMAAALGISPYPIAMGVIYGSSLAFATPLASAQIGMALTVGHNFREIVQYGVLIHVIMYITVIAVIPLFYPF